VANLAKWLAAQRVRRVVIIAGLFPLPVLGLIGAATVVLAAYLNGFREALLECGLALVLLLAIAWASGMDVPVLAASAAVSWLVWAALGAIAAALLFLIGNALFNRNVGIIASLIYALYGPNLFYEGIMLRAALTEFFAVLSFYLLLRLENRPSYKNAFLCGTSLSMMVQCRPNTVVLLALVIFYVLFRAVRSDDFKHRLKYLIIFVCALIVTGMPLLLRGIHAEKKFQFYDPGGPHVFLMGNLTDYDGLGWHNGSPRFKEYLRNSGGKIHDYKWVLNKVLKEIENDPLAFLSLYLRKAYYFLSNYEIPSNNNYYIYQKFSYLLRNPLMNFALMASLAFLGFLVSLRNYRENLLLYIFVLGMTGSVLLFYSVSRLRMPAVPFYLLLASMGIFSFFKFLKDKKFLPFSVAAIMVGSIFLWLSPSNAQKIRANDYGMLGNAYFAKGMHRECIASFTKSLTVNPNNADAHYNIGLSFIKIGKPDDAIYHFNEALKINPKDAGIQNAIGILYAQKGNLKDAAFHFSEAVRVSPENQAARKNLEQCLRLLNQANTPSAK